MVGDGGGRGLGIVNYLARTGKGIAILYRCWGLDPQFSSSAVCLLMGESLPMELSLYLSVLDDSFSEKFTNGQFSVFYMKTFLQGHSKNLS